MFHKKKIMSDKQRNHEEPHRWSDPNNPNNGSGLMDGLRFMLAMAIIISEARATIRCLMERKKPKNRLKTQ